MKKESLRILKRPWFAGGTVQFVTVANKMHALSKGISAFEDGTVNFSSIPAVKTGLEFLECLGMESIHDLVTSLTMKMLEGLKTLRWDNGARAIRIYVPEVCIMRGGTIAFDVVFRDGVRVDARLVESAANERNISLRVGCFCNPGALEWALGVNGRTMRKCFMGMEEDSSWN